MKKLYVIALLMLSGSAYAEPPQWALCSACHGAAGQGGIGPTLRGQTAEYISSRLKAYRAQEYLGEQSPLMWPNAMQLTDEEIEIIAAFVEELK